MKLTKAQQLAIAQDLNRRLREELLEVQRLTRELNEATRILEKLNKIQRREYAAYQARERHRRG